MRVKNVKIHNVMRIQDLNLELEDHSLALVGGKNGQGKTSAITALLMTLCGKRGMDYPDVPLKDGEDEAECVIRLATASDGSDSDVFPDMSEVIVTRRWERKRDGAVKESVTITDEDGQKSSSPQELLNSLYKSRGLSPLALAEAPPAQQRKMLMDLVGLTEEFDQLDAEYAEAYTERATVNAQGKTLKANFEQLKFHEDAPEAEVSVGSLLDELKSAEKENDRVRLVHKSADEADQFVIDATADVARKKEALAKAESVLETAKEEAAKKRQTADEASYIETDPIRARIDSVEEDNAKVRSNQRYKDAKAELDALRNTRDELQATLDAIPLKQRELLTSADWPVADLSIDKDGVLYQGLPESQASLAERIRLWCRVAAALKPKLPLLVFNDGNALDYDSMAELDTFLEESGFQAIVEFVTRNADDEDRCVVVIEDGKALEAVTV